MRMMNPSGNRVFPGLSCLKIVAAGLLLLAGDWMFCLNTANADAA